MEEIHEEPFVIRPRFETETNLSIEKLAETIREHLESDDVCCVGRIYDVYGTIRVPVEERHYWSPQLSLSFEEKEEGDGSLLRGMYGPQPKVWTMFIFFYSLIGFLVIVIAIVGFSQMSLGNSSEILWLLPLLILSFISLYWVSHVGQKKGHDQMTTLHHFIEECV